MHNPRVLRMLGYGASLALLLTLSTPGAPSDVGTSGIAFAQGTGQPSPDQPGTGAGPNQQPGSQQAGPLPVTVLPDIILPFGGQQGTSFDADGEGGEGDDIGEGLSNQRRDPDD